MSMQDARLDHLALRIAELERVLGAGDYEPAPGERTALARLADAEQDIAGLEVRRAVAESEETWAIVRDLVKRRDAGPGSHPLFLNLGYRQVKALADLIEGEWGKQA
jgi:hypothetical protein